jgi:hypothetical protein
MAAVKVPADVELEDRLAFGLTARQLVLFAAAGVGAYGAYVLLTSVAPSVVALAAGLAVALVGVLLALGRYEGMSGDQFALALARYLRSQRRLVLAPDGQAAAPVAAAGRRSRAAVLELPVQRILHNGVVQLIDGSHRLLVDAVGGAFELRSPLEQDAFIDCFGRFLNSRGEPIQIAVCSEPASLDPHADHLDQAARTLPPQLAAAAHDHAAFLRRLTEETQLLRRRIVVVFGSRERSPEVASATLARQVAEAAQLLAGADVALRPLAGEHAAALLAATLDPPGPVIGSHLEGVIHAAPQHAQQEGQDEAARPRSRVAWTWRAARSSRSAPGRGTLAAQLCCRRLPT